MVAMPFTRSEVSWTSEVSPGRINKIMCHKGHDLYMTLQRQLVLEMEVNTHNILDDLWYFLEKAHGQ